MSISPGQPTAGGESRGAEAVPLSPRAKAALRLGLLSFFLGLFTGLPAILQGIRGRREIDLSGGLLGGKRRATAGIVLAAVGSVVCPVGYVYGFLSLRDTIQLATVKSDMEEMARAMHRYNDDFDHLPEPVPDPKLGGRTKLSWRVELLSYLGHDDLYHEFHHDEPWDSPHNKALLTRMPNVFAHPKHPEANREGLTYYRVFTGQLTAFSPGRPSKIPTSFQIGTSNTLLIVEAAEPVPWTKPAELVYDPDKPLPKLGGHFKGKFVVALGDGTARVIRSNIKEEKLRHAIDQTYDPWGQW